MKEYFFTNVITNMKEYFFTNVKHSINYLMTLLVMKMLGSPASD